MAFSLLQPASSNNDSPGSVGTANKAYGIATTVHSLLVCVLSISPGLTPGVSDNVNGAWINAAASTNTNETISLWYFPNCLGGATTVTCTQSGTITAAMRFGMQEWSGVLQLNPLDQTGGATTGSTTTPSVNTSGSTTIANELVVAGISGASGTPTITGAGSTTLDFQTVGRLGIGYQNGGNSPGVQTGSFNYATSDNSCLVIATFKPLSGDTTMGNCVYVMG
jgi:hypothetical protein